MPPSHPSHASHLICLCLMPLVLVGCGGMSRPSGLVPQGVEMRVAGKPTLTLHAGDGFLIPPRTPHNALDIGPETGKMLSTYIVENDQPLSTFTDRQAT